MGYEIDFLPVGEGSRGGDAIALRYGNLHGSRSEQTVVIIDGGYADNGEALVDHVVGRYGTDRVDLVVSTHPDQDHVRGLEVVVEKLHVTTLLMHQPWRHSPEMAAAKRYGFEKAALSAKLEKSLKDVSDLEAIAARNGVEIVEPFAGVGTRDGSFLVVGPTLEYYEELLVEVQAPVAASGSSPFQFLTKAKELAWKLVPETLHIETLRDDGQTSATNNTSAICLLSVDGRKCLFTGDAGIDSLHRATDFMESRGFAAGELTFAQIPHHGSRRNVGPAVLNRLLGPKGQATTHSVAFVSAPPDNPERKHPAKKVTNAYRRRGYDVHATQGTLRWHSFMAPTRLDFTISTPVPFHALVEEDSEAS